MTKDDLKAALLTAFNNNTLLTAKHDPYNLNTPWNTYRTVISHEVADRLFEFIDIGMYKIFEYANNHPNHSQTYYEIIPDSSFNVASSGITAYSTQPHSALNRVIAISGQNQGWHIFGESDSRIQNKVSAGLLTNKTELL